MKNNYYSLKSTRKTSRKKIHSINQKNFKMKMNMKTVEAQGYSKEKALEAAGLDIDFDMLRNATLAWKKAGSPINPKDLNSFMTNYMKRNQLAGVYLVIASVIVFTFHTNIPAFQK